MPVWIDGMDALHYIPLRMIDKLNKEKEMSDRYDMLKKQEQTINTLQDRLTTCHSTIESQKTEYRKLNAHNDDVGEEYAVAVNSAYELRKERDRAIDAWNQILVVNNELNQTHDNITSLWKKSQNACKVAIDQYGEAMTGWKECEVTRDQARDACRKAEQQVQELKIGNLYQRNPAGEYKQQWEELRDYIYGKGQWEGVGLLDTIGKLKREKKELKQDLDHHSGIRQESVNDACKLRSKIYEIRKIAGGDNV